MQPPSNTPPQIPAPSFADLIDLASELMGSEVVAANDDFFAEKENLIKSSSPIFDADRFTDRGKWMDGWETRRRRTPGHDWCIIKLGAPGRVVGFDVDTSHFDGNQPETVTIEGCALADDTNIELLDGDDIEWIDLLNSSPTGPSSHHYFSSDNQLARVTHVRLNIMPDGGVARLRVYGHVLPDWAALSASGDVVDLASAANGGLALTCSDMHFSHKDNLLLPTEPKNMGSGWETKRRRGPGCDWIIIKLGTPGSIEKVAIETTHFKGNYPDSCELEAVSLPHGVDPSEPTQWATLLEQTKLHAHKCHEFESELNNLGDAVSHVRLTIYPDGGVSRLRILGHPTSQRPSSSTVVELDTVRDQH